MERISTDDWKLLLVLDEIETRPNKETTTKVLRSSFLRVVVSSCFPKLLTQYQGFEFDRIDGSHVHR